MRGTKSILDKNGFMSTQSPLGHTWARWFFFLGQWDIGKSYSTTRQGIKWKMREITAGGKPTKFYIVFKNNETMQDALSGDCMTLFDPDLVERWITRAGYFLKRRGDLVFACKAEYEINEKTGQTERTVIATVPFCECIALSNMPGDKELVKFDNRYRGRYVFCVNEINREVRERDTFSLTYSFFRQLHTICRDTKEDIYVFCCGNNAEDASEILLSFNFIPLRYGKFTIKKRKCVIYNIEPTETVTRRMSGSLLDDVADTFNPASFTNELKSDISLIYRGRLLKPKYRIQFFKGNVYTVWDNGVVDESRGENLPLRAMIPYQDAFYTKDIVQSVFDMYHARAFRFRNLYILRKFKKDLSLLKKHG